MRFYFRLNSDARPTFFSPLLSRSPFSLTHSPSASSPPPPLYLVSESKLFPSRPASRCRGRFYHRADGIACNPRYTGSPRFPHFPRRDLPPPRKTRSTSVYLFRALAATERAEGRKAVLSAKSEKISRSCRAKLLTQKSTGSTLRRKS